jgi:hypothetical protein
MGPFLSTFRTGVRKDRKNFNIQNPCGYWGTGRGSEIRRDSSKGRINRNFSVQQTPKKTSEQEKSKVSGGKWELTFNSVAFGTIT